MSAWYVYTMRAATIRQSVGVCRVLYMYRRGLTALLILADGQCESLTSEISKNSSPRFFVMRTRTNILSNGFLFTAGLEGA